MRGNGLSFSVYLTVIVVVMGVILLSASSGMAGCPGSCMCKSSSNDAYAQDYDIRGCDDTEVCPENHYYEKYVTTTVFVCTDCSATYCGRCDCYGYSSTRCADPATCASWKPVGDSGTYTSEDVCIESEANPVSYWYTSYSAPGWKCVGCVNFAYWLFKNGICSIQDYPTLNFTFGGFGIKSPYPFAATSPNTGNKVNIPVTNTTITLKFSTHIAACQDRIPMLHLNASLFDPETGEMKSSVVGIYLKHQSLTYQDNSGELKGLFLPENQKTFKKTYELKVVAKAYRAWAYRRRLAEAINRTGKDLINTQGMPPAPSGGITRLTSDAYFGDPQRRVYYSQDFVGGLAAISTLTHSTTTTYTPEYEYDVAFYKGFPDIGNYKVCTASDLSDYLSSYGMTEELKNAISSVTGIPTDRILDITSIIEDTLALSKNKTVESAPINVTEYGYKNSTELILDVGVNLTKLESIGLTLPESNCSVDDFGTDSPKGCSLNIESVLTRWDIEEINDTHVKLNANYTCKWIIDGETGKIKVKINYTDQVWMHAELGNVDPDAMAACLYYWEDCIKKKRSVTFNGQPCNYYEVAVCGMGPAFDLLSTSEQELYAEYGKDGAVGEKVITTTITTYRSCSHTNWVSRDTIINVDGPSYGLPAGLYACNASQSYPILKCGTDADQTENLVLENGKKFVERANPGTTVYDDETGKLYVCEATTFKGTPLFLPDLVPPVIHSPETSYELVFDNVNQVWVITFKYPNVEDAYDDEHAPTVGKSGVDIVKICTDPGCMQQPLCEWKAGKDESKVCNISIDRCESRTHTYYIVVWDKAGNKNHTTLNIKVQADKDCDCSTSSDCATGTCVRSKCVESASVPKSASLIVTSNLDITVGVEKRLVVTIKNPNTFNELIDLKLNTSGCSRFVRAWFMGYEGTPYEKETSLTIMPGKIARIPVMVYTPFYDPTKPSCTLKITATSWSTSQKQVANVALNFKELVAEGAETQAPGIELVQLMAVMVVSTLILLLRRNA